MATKDSQQASRSSGNINEEAYKNGQGTSLLCHPLGVLLLEHYHSVAKETDDADDADEEGASEEPREVSWFRDLHSKLKTIKYIHGESGLTNAMFSMFDDHYPGPVYTQEQRSCTIYDWRTGKGVDFSGAFDIALGKGPSGSSAEVPKKRDERKVSRDNQKEQQKTEPQKDPKKSIDKDIVGIFEVGIDSNGGFQKLPQVMRYASLVRGRHFHHESKDEYIIVATFHFVTSKKRNRKNDNKKEIQDIAVHVYLCRISWNVKAKCPQSEYALLWREKASGFQQQSEEPVIGYGWRSIARAVATVAKLAELERSRDGMSRDGMGRFREWKLKGPNCAQVCSGSEDNESNTYMLKIFDNRYTPTVRSPFLWFQDCVSRQESVGSNVSSLAVQPFLLLNEKYVLNPDQNGHDRLPVYTHTQEGDAEAAKTAIIGSSYDGSMRGADTSGTSLLGDAWTKEYTKKIVPFGAGVVVILRYNYIKGSHFPESPQSFLPVLDHLGSIHKAGYVHGDIRLYNMIFEETGAADKQQRQNACLLDFDFGGLRKKREYPIGYRYDLNDIKGERAGRGREVLTPWNDLADLIGVVLLFSVKSNYVLEKEQEQGRLNAELREMEGELDVQKASWEAKRDAWKAKRDELKAKKDELDVKNAAWKAKNTELVAKLLENVGQDQATALKKEVDTLQVEADALQEEVNALEAEADALEADVENIGTQVNTLEGQVKAHKHALDTMSAEVETANNSVKKWRKELADVRSRLLEKGEEEIDVDGNEEYEALRVLLVNEPQADMDLKLHFTKDNSVAKSVLALSKTMQAATGTPDRTFGGAR